MPYPQYFPVVFADSPALRRWLVRALAAMLFLACIGVAQAQTPVLRVMTHSSFDLDKQLIQNFEKDCLCKIELLQGGDAGQMLNKLILTAANPIADVVYGIDNTLAAKAQPILAPQPSSPAPAAIVDPLIAQALPANLAPIDYGWVAINADSAWFEQHQLPLPQSLEDLSKPAYKDLLVVQNPATSSPGLAFFLAVAQRLGNKASLAWWQDMKANGVKVSNGWTQAYQHEFSLHGGKRPLVVSYVSSPAAEVFYSAGKMQTAPTQVLSIAGTTWLQVEGAGLVRQPKAQPGTVQRAAQFIAFLQSPAVQSDLQTRMWMFPARSGTALQAPLQTLVKPKERTLPTVPDDPTLKSMIHAWTRLMRS